MTIKRVSRVLQGKLDTSNTPSSPYRPAFIDAPISAPEPSAVKRRNTDLPVDLSAAAQLRSKQGRHRSMQDIEDSGLPKQIKDLLILQRDSKQKIIKTISELQALQHNMQIRADLRKQRTHMMRTEIMALESTYKQAIQHIDSLMTQMAMPDEQADIVALLLMS